MLTVQQTGQLAKDREKNELWSKVAQGASSGCCAGAPRANEIGAVLVIVAPSVGGWPPGMRINMLEKPLIPPLCATRL